jgi:hypothetical protein
MTLYEFFDSSPDAYYSGSQDNSALETNAKRKTRLTLEQINRLRIMNDIRRLEYEKSIEKITKQYSPPAAAPGGMM